MMRFGAKIALLKFKEKISLYLIRSSDGEGMIMKMKFEESNHNLE